MCHSKNDSQCGAIIKIQCILKGIVAAVELLLIHGNISTKGFLTPI
uniref:Uncharacterized protein n=1 Tax=Anguilla anguilla TaxID=7936 RepID=A0A0E9WQF8_ANGAN